MTRRNKLRIATLIVAAALAIAATAGFHGAGRWLVREDPLGPANVIVVLSGSMPYRAEEAARIFRMGFAHEVWITHPESPGGQLAAMGIHYTGDDEYSREVLVHEGVPESSVRILPGTIIDTEQEIEEVAREMRREKLTRAIVVTSPPHTRRVKVLWRELAGPNLHCIVRAAYQAPFDAAHWWRNTRDVYAVVREMLGLVNAWIGLPVQPHPS